MDCLFCKIVLGEIPATVVQQNDEFVSFRDISPQAPTHILTIPRRHIGSLNDADDGALMGRMVMFVRDLARAEGVDEAGYRVVLNTNADGGQTVFHLHAHLLAGRRLAWPPG